MSLLQKSLTALLSRVLNGHGGTLHTSWQTTETATEDACAKRDNPVNSNETTLKRFSKTCWWSTHFILKQASLIFWHMKRNLVLLFAKYVFTGSSGIMCSLLLYCTPVRGQQHSRSWRQSACSVGQQVNLKTTQPKNNTHTRVILFLITSLHHRPSLLNIHIEWYHSEESSVALEAWLRWITWI